MTRRFGKQTAPGFADPALPVSLDRPVEDEGLDIAAEHATTAAEGRPTASPLVPTPSIPVVEPRTQLARQDDPLTTTPNPNRVAVQPERVVARGDDAPQSRLPERPTSKTPMVEVEVSYERGPAPRALPMRRWLELWTQNSVYVLDSRMRCLEVRSTSTGDATTDHPFVNTRLVGGQWHGEDGVELSYPLPRPGSCAVFEGRRGNKRRFSRTSSVERVVMRLQVVSVTGPNVVPSWEDLVD